MVFTNSWSSLHTFVWFYHLDATPPLVAHSLLPVWPVIYWDVEVWLCGAWTHVLYQLNRLKLNKSYCYNFCSLKQRYESQKWGVWGSVKSSYWTEWWPGRCICMGKPHIRHCRSFTKRMSTERGQENVWYPLQDVLYPTPYGGHKL